METSVPHSVRKQRAEEMRGLSNQRLRQQAENQKGLVKKTLVLKKGQTLSRDYWNIKLPSVDPVMAAGWAGQEVDVRIVGTEVQINQNDCHLIGEIDG